MSEKSLYHISSNLINLHQELEKNCGELTEENESLLEQLSIELKTKTDGVIDYVKSQENFIEAIDKRLKELQELKRTSKNKLDNFNKYVVNCMDLLDEKKLQGSYGSISVRKPTVVVEIVNEDDIAPEYLNVKKVVTINKTAIKKDLQAEKKVNGAKLTTGQRKASFK